MKNFRNLDTYVDLPDLISSIKKWKLYDILKGAKEQKPPSDSFNDSVPIRDKLINSSLHKKIKKELG